ncbi:MAG: hypothetical protein Q9205_004974 [Flavoplaca limonia]
MAAGSPQSAKVPSSRFNINAFYDPQPDRPGSLNIPGGYFLDEDPTDFDPTFFGITPIEATWMDPQQRKLLEVVYEALESSGTPLDKLVGSSTGCFVGSFTSDFQQMSFKEHDFRHTYSATGVDPGILSSRIAHVFDLRGPSAMINCACSSSLAALHMACSAIQSHDCEAAFVGGSNLILTVDQHLNTAKLGVLSPTSRCHTFDKRADGYARAEGVGALYIKSLSSALRDGDPVRAVIRSTAINSNGRITGVGISHPSVDGQYQVIRKAYEKAAIDPSHTGYIECHGTGTQAGDPKELEAISKAIVAESKHSSPLLVGSVKPNIGHSEASSSISTIIKAVLAIENGIIPPTAGISELNAEIPWKTLNIQVVVEPTKFPISLPGRRVSINASGYGGTNAHAILENLPARDRQGSKYKSILKADMPYDVSITATRPHLVVFSAHSKPTLLRNVRQHADMSYKPKLVDLAYTLAECRSTLNFRSYAVCRQDSFTADILAALQAVRESTTSPTIGFVFTGQGAQWPMMGSHLFKVFPTYRQTIQRLDQVLARLEFPPVWTIEGCLSDCDSPYNVHDPEISQPLCTAVQIGLVELLAKWEVYPTVAIGHSSGEIAAAFTSGYLSIDDAMLVAFLRGKAIAACKTDGAMLAVNLGPAEILPYIGVYDGKVRIACHNSDSNVTLSGNADIVDELKVRFETSHIVARKIKTGGRAYHSQHMASVALQYRDMLETTRSFCSPHSLLPQNQRPCRMISTVTGDHLDDKEIDATYWALNLESPVFFKQAMHKAIETTPSLNMLVEVGPHPALSGPIRQIFSSSNKALSYLPTLKRYQNDIDQLLILAGELWAKGSPLNLSAVTRVERLLQNGTLESAPGSLLVDLPIYQWDYSKKYFSEPRQSQEHRECKYPRHDLLGRRIPGLSLAEPQWRNVLRLADLPWLKDHKLGQDIVFPAAGYLAMAIEAITQMKTVSWDVRDIQSYSLRDVSIPTALAVPDDQDGVETLFSLHPLKTEATLPPKNVSHQWYSFRLVSVTKQHDSWNEHATGTVGVNMSPKKMEFPLNAKASGRSWYRSLTQAGFIYGPTFQNIINVRADYKRRVASCETMLSPGPEPTLKGSASSIHPGIVDCCLQSIIVSIYAGQLSKVVHGFVPVRIDSVDLWTTNIPENGESAVVKTDVYDGEDRRFIANSQMASKHQQLIIDFQGVHCVAYEAAVPQLIQQSYQKLTYWQSRWLPDLRMSSMCTALEIFEDPKAMDVVSLLCHNNASMKLLDIDGTFTSDMTGGNNFVNITVCVPTEELYHTMQKSLKDRDFVNRRGVDIDWNLLKEAQPRPRDQIIILDDAEEAILSNLQEDELKHLQGLTSTSARILWVTSGDLLSCQKPKHAMASGLARCLRSENASLDLITVDIDTASTSDEQMSKTIAMLIDRQAAAHGDLEAEYIVKNGLLYTSRLTPIYDRGDTYPSSTNEVHSVPLETNSVYEAEVRSNELYFRNRGVPLDLPGPANAVVSISAIGVNPAHSLNDMKSSYQGASMNDIGGVVKALGSEVSHLKIGDRVIGFSPNNFSTMQNLYASQLCPIREDESLPTLVSLPVAFSTAFHGLLELAQLESGETVLILDSTGIAGLAAVQVCRKVHANFIIVCQKEENYTHLREAGYSEDQVVVFHNGNFSSEIEKLMGSVRVDVVFSGHVTDDVVQNSIQVLAPYARIVLLGQRDRHRAFLKKSPDFGELTVFHLDMMEVCGAGPSLRFDSNAVYLLVGCFGGVGRSLTTWMIDHGAKHLAFMARSGSESPSAANFVSSIETRGIEVTVLKCDVAIKEDVETAIRSVSRDRKLRGVVNAAMVLNVSDVHPFEATVLKKCIRTGCSNLWIRRSGARRLAPKSKGRRTFTKRSKGLT